jgi:transposase
MSEGYQRIELTGTARRRHWSTEQKLRIIEESYEPVSAVRFELNTCLPSRQGAEAILLRLWRR